METYLITHIMTQRVGLMININYSDVNDIIASRLHWNKSHW